MTTPAQSEVPRIVVTFGDPVGIGAEVVTRTLFAEELRERAEILLLADPKHLAAVEQLMSQRLPLVDEGPGVRLLPRPAARKIAQGCASAEAGSYALSLLSEAVGFVQAGEADGILFGPLNKSSLHLAGMDEHDELRWFQKQLGFDGFTSEVNILPDLWTSRVTSHIPMKDVAAAITEERVIEAIRLLNRLLQGNGIEQPRLAVCALNAHAGDNGNFGDEEITTIGPGVEKAAAEGITVSGPFPSDTLFIAARDGRYDGVVTMYHDQGQIALKLIGFDKGVTLEAGLPVAVSTPAHGTAFDLVGQGTANLGSTEHAFDVVINLANQAREKQVAV